MREVRTMTIRHLILAIYATVAVACVPTNSDTASGGGGAGGEVEPPPVVVNLCRPGRANCDGDWSNGCECFGQCDAEGACVVTP